jgi:hypothetical protein
MVPMRGVFEALNAKVEWDNATRTVTATKGDTTIKLTIGNKYAYVNGQKVALATEAIIVNGSTMVPLRFVAESLGAKVEWNNATRTAIITNQDQSGGKVTNPSQIVINPTNQTKPTNPTNNQSKPSTERIYVDGIDATETNGRTYGVANQ